MEVKPFRAWLYNPAVVGDPGACIAPPYDVIDDSQQEKLYQQHPYNIVRVIWGKRYADDNATQNVYTRARDFLQKAIADKAIVQDSQPSLYAYVQDFSRNGKPYQRRGIIGLVKVEPFGKTVRAHEKTLEGPKADRLNLLKATATQCEQIFMLYDDPSQTDQQVFSALDWNTPLLDAVDSTGVRHRLYRIHQQEVIDAFVRMLADKPVVIADGHHRYETALNYWKLIGCPQAQYTMAALVNIRQPGLVIQPTHRLIFNIAGWDSRRFLAELRKDFQIETFAFRDPSSRGAAQDKMAAAMADKAARQAVALGVYVGDGAFYVATLSDWSAMSAAAPTLSAAAQRLDVNVLHRLILEKHLGIGEAQLAAQTHIEYIKDDPEAISAALARVDAKTAQALFVVNPTRVEQVMALSAAGEKMPQKSTYFYPKIFSGLTINVLPAEPMAVNL